MRTLPLSLFALFGMLFSLIAAEAQPTMLNNAPTAYSLAADSFSFRWRAAGNAMLNREEVPTQYLTTRLGLTNRWEVGAAFAVDTGIRCSLNSKLMLLPQSHGLPALAVGVQDATTNSSGPYLMLSRSLGDLGLHLGTLYAREQWQPTGGINLGIGKTWGAQVDFLSGPAGHVSLGATCACADDLSFVLCHSRAHNRENDFTGMSLVWESPLFR